MIDRLNYKGYYAEVHFSSKDKVYHGKIADVSDLILFEASSIPGLNQAFAEAVDDYLETCREINKASGISTRQ
ncbi:MAG: hypothetical protein V4649_02030 [Bacteroidota bacterium]